MDMELLTPTFSSSPSAAAETSLEPVACRDTLAEVKSQRQVIAETLQQLHNNSQQQREREAHLREEQDEFTRSVIKIMHLDTTDYDKIVLHAQNVTQQNAIAAIFDRMRALEAAYQLAKKDLAAINDKKLRHERVQIEKRRRDDALGPLRTRLQQLDPSIRPGSSLRDSDEKTSDSNKKKIAPANILPSIGGTGHKRGNHPPPNYRDVMTAIRKLQHERREMLDPYQANLKLARLWRSINDHERALEDFEKACRSLSEKQIARILLDERAHALERERLRKREALQYLFTQALQLKERKEAAELMARYLDLSTATERPKTVAYLEGILRKQEYIEDETLATPEAVTQSILVTNSLGFLTDLRFQLLQEMLAASPTDAYLLDAVEIMHVRRRAYEPAKQLSDRFVKLPEVKRCSLFASFAESQCTGLTEKK